MTMQAIGAIVGHVGGKLFENYMNKKNAKEMAKYQNDIAIDNWHRENRYNSPTAQMQRLKQANLNPNLIYQSGSAIQPSGSIDQPQVATPQMDIDPVGAYQQVRQMSLQNDSVAQSIATGVAMEDYYQNLGNIAHMDYLKKRAESHYFDDNAKYQSVTAMHNMDKAAAEVDQVKATTSLLYSQTGLTQEQIENAKVSREQMRATIAQIGKQNSLTDAQIRQCNASVDKILAEVQETLARTQIARKDLVLKGVEIELQNTIASYKGDEIRANLAKMSQEIEALDFSNATRGADKVMDYTERVFGIIQGFLPNKKR